MANNRCTYQQMYNVSVPKENLLKIAKDEALNKKDYKVFICLLTELDGWKPSKDMKTKDPLNFKKIDVSKIADELDMTKKEVKKSISNLMKYGIIEDGDTKTLECGYRFQF